MSTSSAVPESAPSRPAVLSLTIRERAALYAAYMPFYKMEDSLSQRLNLVIWAMKFFSYYH